MIRKRIKFVMIPLSGMFTTYPLSHSEPCLNDTQLHFSVSHISVIALVSANLTLSSLYYPKKTIPVLPQARDFFTTKNTKRTKKIFVFFVPFVVQFWLRPKPGFFGKYEVAPLRLTFCTVAGCNCRILLPQSHEDFRFQLVQKLLVLMFLPVNLARRQPGEPDPKSQGFGGLFILSAQGPKIRIFGGQAFHLLLPLRKMFFEMFEHFFIIGEKIFRAQMVLRIGKRGGKSIQSCLKSV